MSSSNFIQRGGRPARLVSFGPLAVRFARRFALPLALLLLGGGAARADEPGPESMRAIWVVRSTMTSPERLDRMVQRARLYGVTDLFVQVRGRADAFYRSSLEPRAEAIADTGFDPLAYTIRLAHQQGLRVHAWVNTFLVWSATNSPRNPAHLANAHPDWSAIRPDGHSLWSMTRDELDQTIVEGIYTAPGNPAVRQEFLEVVGDILSRYDVDGLHLDYVRYPSTAVGFDYASRTEFMRETGVDPAWLADRPEYLKARYGAAGVDDLARRWQEWQKWTVTQTVRGVRAVVDSIRPQARLSAAVISDLDAAAGRNRQDWISWLREGLIDFAVPMTYTPSVRTFELQLRRILAQAGGRPVVAGIGVYDQRAPDAARKILLARRLGAAGVSLFSYDAIESQPSYWQALRSAYLGFR